MAAGSRGIQWRWLPLVLIISWLSVLVTSFPPNVGSTKPHIVFILADDLGWNDVSWHNPKAITPNLETLAKEGILLEQSYVQPTCTPTRSALLTGRYPYTIGRQRNVLGSNTPTGLLLNATLLPQSLKDVGYSTHAVGKWHLGFCHWDYTPTYRGFDTFYGYYLGGEDHYAHTSVTKSSGENKLSSGDFPYGYDFRNNTEPDLSVDGSYDTDIFSLYVEQLLKSRNPEDPMFLYLALQSVHVPMQVPEMYTEPFQYIADEDRQILLGMSWAMDDAVGNVVDALKATGHYENSIIIFSSDNGGQLNFGNNWPLRGAKGSLYEGGTRAPGFIHSPLLQETGFISNTLFHVTDWYATLVGLAGGVVPETTDGFDQWEALTMGTESPRTSMVYSMEDATTGDDVTQVNAAIRNGEYKLIVGKAGKGSWTPPPEGIDMDGQRIRVLHDKCVIVDGFQGKRSSHEDNVNDDDSTNRKLEEDIDNSRTMGLTHNNTTDTQLYNVIDDPEERENIADSYPDIVQGLMDDLQHELLRLVPEDTPPADPSGDPKYFDNVWSPGWCHVE